MWDGPIWFDCYISIICEAKCKPATLSTPQQINVKWPVIRKNGPLAIMG